MGVPISNVTRRVVFAPSGVGPYAFTFEILADTDIEVYKGDNLLTLTTDYTVTINPNGTGEVTLVATAGTDNITIVGARAIERTTDFVTGGDFFANTVNNEFDSLTIFAQQNAEAVTRSIQAPVTDPTTIDMTLPVKADRAGKYLSFDADGDPETVNAMVDVTTVAGIAADVTKVSNIAANVTTVAGVSANVTTVAGISGNVTTVAGISGNVTTVAGNTTNINTVAGNNTNITTVAGISKDVTTVAGISANVTSVAGNSTNINTVATDLAGTNTIGTVATNIANVNKVGAIDANVTKVADIDGNVTTVAGISSNVTTVAGVAANVTTVAGISANVTTVAGISANVTTVATNVADVTNYADTYLGAKTSDPATRNDSSALQAGDLYFNTVDDVMKVYDGSAWMAAFASLSGALVATNNLSDLADKSAARTNLELTALATTVPGTGAATFLATPSSANLASALTDETGSGLAVFNANPLFTTLRETATIAATAATGTINFDAITQSVLYYTSNASGNWTLNVRGDSGTSLDSIMSTGQSLTIAFLVTNGGTAYYQTALNIDGSAVTPKWQGGTAPTAGNIDSIDIYSITIVKTGSATFTAFEAQTQFK